MAGDQYFEDAERGTVWETALGSRSGVGWVGAMELLMSVGSRMSWAETQLRPYPSQSTSYWMQPPRHLESSRSRTRYAGAPSASRARGGESGGTTSARAPGITGLRRET